MKKIVSLMLALMLCVSLAACVGNGNEADPTGAVAADEAFTVGICQLIVHDSLDQATAGFMDALTEELAKESKAAEFDTQVAGEEKENLTVEQLLYLFRINVEKSLKK